MQVTDTERVLPGTYPRVATDKRRDEHSHTSNPPFTY